MNKYNTEVEKIRGEYSAVFFARATISYNDSITILSNDKLLFHYKKGSNFFINDYEDNQGKYSFSESDKNISTRGFGKNKYNIANQILLRNEPYIVIKDGKIMEYYVIKDENKYDSLLIKEELPFNDIKTEYMNRIQLEQFLGKRKNEKLYILNDNGGIYEAPEKEDSSFFIPSEKQTVNRIKTEKLNKINDYRRKLIMNQSNKDDEKLKKLYELKAYYENMNLDNLEELINIFDNDIILIRIKDEEIIIQDVYIYLVGLNEYKVQIMNLPINKYNIEDINNNKLKITNNKVLKK